MPLYESRNRMGELDKNERYIVYCHAGGRSAVATLILAQNQFDVVSLEGGIRDWPFETASVEDAVAEPLKEVVNANQSNRNRPGRLLAQEPRPSINSCHPKKSIHSASNWKNLRWNTGTWTMSFTT